MRSNEEQKQSKNPFKEIEGNEPAPDGLKDQVMNSVRFAEFLVKVGELFTLNFFRTGGALTNLGDSKGEPDKAGESDQTGQVSPKNENKLN